MASVERRVDRHGTGYRVRYRDMADKQRSRTFRRKIDAQQFAAAVEADKARGTFIDPRAGKQLFADFADEWAAAQGDWKATTRESWTYSRARLVELVGDRPLGSIDLLTLQALQQALSERYSRATRRSHDELRRRGHENRIHDSADRSRPDTRAAVSEGKSGGARRKGRA